MEGVSHKIWSLIVVLFTQRSIYGFTLHIYILSLEYIKLHSSEDNNTLHPQPAGGLTRQPKAHVDPTAMAPAHGAAELAEASSA